jgi:hypothetical protein
MKLTQQIEEIIKERDDIKILSGRITSTHNYAQLIDNELDELRKIVKQLTQQRERFQHNLMYLEVVEDIITCTETEWDNKTFNNMLVKLVGKDEVYKVFISTTNAPVIGHKKHFTFNADENKLSKLKILE